MLENQLNGRLKSAKRFVGSYAADELKDVELKFYPSFLVINLGEHNLLGSHWIALAIYDNDIYICDSLGGITPDKKVPVEIINYLDLVSKHRTLYITKQLQPLTSDKCGEYCVLFVKEMLKNHSFCQFLSLFTLEKERNDKIVNFLTKK